MEEEEHLHCVCTTPSQYSEEQDNNQTVNHNHNNTCLSDNKMFDIVNKITEPSIDETILKLVAGVKRCIAKQNEHGAPVQVTHQTLSDRIKINKMMEDIWQEGKIIEEKWDQVAIKEKELEYMKIRLEDDRIKLEKEKAKILEERNKLKKERWELASEQEEFEQKLNIFKKEKWEVKKMKQEAGKDINEARRYKDQIKAELESEKSIFMKSQAEKLEAAECINLEYCAQITKRQNELEIQAQQFKDAITKVQNQKETADKQIEILKQQIEAYKQQIGENESQKLSLQTQICECKKHIDYMKNLSKEESDSLNALKVANQRLQQQLSEQNEVLKKLVEDNKILMAENETLTIKKTEQVTKLEEAKKQLQEVSDKLEKDNEELQTTKEFLQKKESEIKTVLKFFSKLIRENVELKQNLVGANQAMKIMDDTQERDIIIQKREKEFIVKEKKVLHINERKDFEDAKIFEQTPIKVRTGTPCSQPGKPSRLRRTPKLSADTFYSRPCATKPPTAEEKRILKKMMLITPFTLKKGPRNSQLESS